MYIAVLKGLKHYLGRNLAATFPPARVINSTGSEASAFSIVEGGPVRRPATAARPQQGAKACGEPRRACRNDAVRETHIGMFL